MAFSIGLFTSDPNLLRCELARLRHDVLVGNASEEPLGAGWYAEDNVLLQRYAARVRPEGLEQLGGVLESDALVVHAGPLPLAVSLEENTQPFRYRQWLFTAQGALSNGERLRARVMDEVPEHLARAVKGDMPHELCFALFLAELRETGRTDDARLDARTLAQALGKATRRYEQLAAEAGSRTSGLVCIATNNRALAAARVGEQPLYYRLLEGSPSCEVCKLDGSAESEPSLRAHLRRRTVVVATHVREPLAWHPVDSGQAVGVGRNLGVEKVGF